MSTFIPPGDAPKKATPEKVAAVTQAVAAAVGGMLRPEPLVVVITHEPFLDWFTLEFNGQTEELDHMEALQWFEAHGAKNMDAVNDAISQAYNFHRAEVVISNPTMQGPAGDKSRYEPKI